MKRTFVCSMMFVLACALLPAAASATPVAYDEAVGGDLHDVAPITVFTFDLGVNTISGTVGLNVPDWFDPFGFTVPNGMFVASGNLTLSDAIGNMNFVEWSLRTGALSLNGGTLLELVHADSPGSHSFPVMAAGQYNMSSGTFGFSGPGPASANFTFTFNVVPEPTSLSIFALSVIPLVRRPRIGQKNI